MYKKSNWDVCRAGKKVKVKVKLNFIGSWIGLSFSAVCFARELIENDGGGVGYGG